MLRVESLAVAFGGVHALRGVSLEVGVGKAVAVIGPNGAGKSTLMRAIAGHVRPSEGTVDFDGARATAVPAYKMARRGMAFVAEGHKTLVGMSVEDNLKAAAVAAGRDGRRRKRPSIGEVKDLFPRLRERASQDAALLSGGERQILGFAMALLSGPKLILLDEPSLGLAPAMITTVYEHIQSLTDMGISLLIVEQNAHQVLRITDRAYVLNRGAIIASGTASEISKDTDLLETYLGG